MNWLHVQIDLFDIEPEPVERALVSLGATSITFSDGGDEPILEPDPGGTPLWNNVRIAALLDEDLSETRVRLAVAASIGPARMPPIRFSILEEQDWLANWRESLRPMQFGAHFWICPPRISCPDPNGIVVRISPGLAFGSGFHPTTALCLEWLTNLQIDEKSVLDFGCGSGILGIASLALGAGQVTAIDHDEQALAATRDNARYNQCIDRIRAISGDQLDAADTFDVIMANILSETLIQLAPSLRDHCRSGARIALSGIVSNAYEQWFALDPPVEKDDWIMLSGIAA
jgi:ribosomal protein L11 methyltransferase